MQIVCHVASVTHHQLSMEAVYSILVAGCINLLNHTSFVYTVQSSFFLLDIDHCAMSVTLQGHIIVYMILHGYD